MKKEKGKIGRPRLSNESKVAKTISIDASLNDWIKKNIDNFSKFVSDAVLKVKKK